jgi:hypothetical protein
MHHSLVLNDEEELELDDPNAIDLDGSQVDNDQAK